MTIWFLLVFIGWVTLFVFTIIGLINPKKLQFLNNNKPITRIQILIGFIIGFVIFSILLVITSPSEGQRQNNVQSEVVATPVESKEVHYEIISDENTRNVTRKVNVELAERVSKTELEEIAHKIKDQDKYDYERTFIMYRIQGEKSVAAWATSHFDPDLKITLLGLDAAQYNKLIHQNLNVDGDVIGQWIETVGTDAVTVFYKKGQRIYKQNFYIDGSSEPEELVKSNNKYKFKNSNENFYFVINEQGNLESWGESGNTAIAKKLAK